MEGYFRLGTVNQHKDLLKPGDSCLGGGYYHFDYTSNRIILDRSSYDFGKPKWHLLETLKVPSVYRGLRLVYFYDDDREFDVSQELQIEYYDWLRFHEGCQNPTRLDYTDNPLNSVKHSGAFGKIPTKV